MEIISKESTPPFVRLDGNGWGVSGPRTFSGHVSTLIALYPDDLPEVITLAERASADGLHVVGFISYEAAAALNPDLPSLHHLPDLPLAWFALFKDCVAPVRSHGASKLLPLQPIVGYRDYLSKARRSQDYIAAGDCYQVNLTFPLSCRYADTPTSLYARLLRSQPATYSIFIDAGPFSVLSLSPELFFRRTEESIVTRPMKGTAHRGRFPEEDRLRAEELKNSPKERAENLMIVDLLRNDLGMVAETGTVRVPELFSIETMPTVHQMTSTVTARLEASRSLLEIMAALFPCGSVTGAPKRRAMEIIAALEGRPRGIYCGAIGYLSPGGTATFSVAIRTLLLDHSTKTATLGIGSGITTDSAPEQEFRECLAKAGFATGHAQVPGLIESLRLENNRYPLLERHLTRLDWSAKRLGIPSDMDNVRQLLETESLYNGILKVRLHLSPDGEMSIVSSPLEEEGLTLAVSVDTDYPVDPDDILLYIKTDRRAIYEAARARHPHSDEVLLVNNRGELTEGSYNSLVLEIEGEKLTPPLTSGLLPGIFRESMLDEGKIREKVLYPSDLRRADAIWLINAVRGWRCGTLIDN